MDRLADIKSHPKYPFAGFAEDDEAFLMSQMYWLELFKSVIARSPHAWTAWFPKPERDGNPIFSSLCPELRRGVIIIQFVRGPEPSEPDPETPPTPLLAAWMDTFASDPPIEHLTLSCEISPVTEGFCRRLLHAYTVDTLARKAMEQQIRDIDIEAEAARRGAPT